MSDAIEFEIAGRKFLLYPLLRARGSLLRLANLRKMIRDMDDVDGLVAMITEILRTSTNLSAEDADAILADLSIEDAGKIVQAYTGQVGQSPFGPSETT